MKAAASDLSGVMRQLAVFVETHGGTELGRIARYAGVPSQHLEDALRGKLSLSRAELEAVAEAMGIGAPEPV